MLGLLTASSNLEINKMVVKLSLRRTLSLPNLPVSEDDTTDQPIDFSKKYGETNKAAKNFSFPLYAETDLDQPTDYALRYAEDDSDIEECGDKMNNDTVKTYCTEDTPYETPFNFSTSTSMSDLREGTKASAKKPSDKMKSTFSSGLMSPDKPISYCDEGTPGYFSRVDSCGSLNSHKTETKENQIKVKAVKFEPVVNYVEETPLMFSRSSSLGSLDSIEQASIQDDRSSVVSDFSRLTSGIISPSELPDSPSQTIPPSPKPRPNAIVFPEKCDGANEVSGDVFEDAVKNFQVESTPLQFSTATSLSSLIGEAREVGKKEDLSENEEDDDILAECINFGMKNNRYSQLGAGKEKTDITSDSIKTYCTEDTPAILSHAGSHSDLSLLSLQTNDKSTNGTNNNLENLQNGDDQEKSEEQPSFSSIQEHTDENENLEPLDHPSRHSSQSYSSDVSHESEEAFLQECILAGMPKKIEKPKKQNEEASDDDEDDKDADILANCINFGMANNKYIQRKNEVDAVKSYCTEDTPAILSYAGSCFELSDLDDLNSDDDDDEGLLAECVRFGMAKIAEKSKAEQAEEGSSSKSNVEAILSDESSSHSSFSSSASSSDEEELLQECILSGMTKLSSKPTSTTSHLTYKEKLALHQIIVEGMKKCQISQQPQKTDSTSDLTEDEHALLRQCILSGMPKNKNLTLGGPAANRESTELTEADRLLLQQCILAGMPKMKARKKKERKGEEPGHNCCVHCPRNKNNVKAKKKYKEKVSESRNVVYVASQIYAIKREVVHKSRKKWV